MSRAGLRAPFAGREPWCPQISQESGVDLDGQYYSEQTGGDLFDAVRIGSRVAFILADIAGRRPEVDPISVKMQEVFRASSAELFSAANVNLTEATEALIYAINHALFGAANGVRFAPTMVGCYDAQLGILAYINAGGQMAMFQDSDGIRALPNVSVPLGLFTHLPYDASLQAFEPGAMLLVVTRGVTECLGGKNPSSTDQLIEVLQQSKPKSASDVCRAVLEAAHQSEKRRLKWLPFRRAPARKDMTALAMVRSI